MPKGSKLLPILNRDGDGLILSGVGPRAGLAFLKAYFPQTANVVRIASGYFQLSGFDLARASLA